ncbi:MAG: aminotransferase class I/II-fold pyridoxal phosphate-dependent enzyme, partial [Bacteroidales bacterium]|nr:aminotransferase class I/II-fold pyridoxal phosphate-dependent enzyme [Bacteroidales bacterium]
MITINEHYAELPASYLFSEIARRVKAYQEQNPNADIIKMGIGDVTLPLPKACLDAMHKAVDELGFKETFRGYGPEQGYTFLQEKIAEFDYKPYGVEIGVDEIFVSDGAKSDTGNIGDILGIDNKIAVTDPVYPVYVDTNVMAGRAGKLLESGCWSNIVYLPTKAENGFVPALPKQEVSATYHGYPHKLPRTTLPQ